VGKKPAVFLAYAAFEERQGRVAEARALLQKVVNSISPGLLEAIVQQVNFERRQSSGDYTATLAAYQAALDHFEGVEGDDTKRQCKDEFVFLSMHLARFLARIGDNTRAREVYEKAEQIKPSNATLWLAHIQFESGQSGDVEATVRPLYEKALTATSSQQDANKTLWQLFVAFMQDRSSDLQAIRDVEDRFAALQATRTTASQNQNRKRKGHGGHDGYHKQPRHDNYGRGGGYYNNRGPSRGYGY
jgi:tetratricopeptide (TPR) repeat protein